MRRPWELGHNMERGPNCPRVYVPLTLPDAASSTFAVLELVGFSSSPSSSQSSLSPSLSSFPPLQQHDSFICHSQPAQQQQQQQHLPLSISLSHPHLVAASFHAPTNENSPHLPLSPQTKSYAKGPQIISEVTLSTKTVATPAAPPLVGKKTAATPAASPLVVAKKTAAPFDGRVHVVQAEAKENVVHTTSINFKDVVQKLTGASCNDEDMMPITLPNRPAVTMPNSTKTSTNKVMDVLSVRTTSIKGFKQASSKLHERRKALHNLQRLCTSRSLALSASSVSPPSPSPVTPLASYFEKLCNATTPTASQSSRSSGVSSPRASFPDSDSSNTSIIAPCASSIVKHCTSSPSKGGVLVSSKAKQCASQLQSFGGPSLLNLFPESPICSPSDI